MKNDTSKKVYSKYGFFKSLFSCFLCVLVIYLIFTPIFYFYNKLLLSGWVYILASILQLLAVVASGICLSAGACFPTSRCGVYASVYYVDWCLCSFYI